MPPHADADLPQVGVRRSTRRTRQPWVLDPAFEEYTAKAIKQSLVENMSSTYAQANAAFATLQETFVGTPKQVRDKYVSDAVDCAMKCLYAAIDEPWK